MFARRWFGGHYFGIRFWGDGDDTAPEESARMLYTVAAEARTYTVPVEARMYTVAAEPRTYTIAAENRTYTVT